MKRDDFVTAMQQGYGAQDNTIQLGAAMIEGQVFADAPVRLPLRTMNRHGLISGATGTGKTKTLQMIAEGLSELGVPVLLMDIKGDLSGLAMPGLSSAAVDEPRDRRHRVVAERVSHRVSHLVARARRSRPRYRDGIWAAALFENPRAE